MSNCDKLKVIINHVKITNENRTLSGVAQVKQNLTLAGELAMQQATKGMTLELDETMLNINRTITTIFFQVGRYQHVLHQLHLDPNPSRHTPPIHNV